MTREPAVAKIYPPTAAPETTGAMAGKQETGGGGQVADPELLRRYADEKSEEAFAELVRRHLPPVYAFALRRVNGDKHLAEDVAQVVFTTLARKAGALTERVVLGGWLCRTTHFAARDIVRTESRRRAREQEALIMQESSTDGEANIDWEKLHPVIDQTLGELNDADRDAVWLRFFEGRSFAEVGARLRLTKNAARMRVERALDKLHAALARRGVTSTRAALGVALASQAATVTPAGLAASVTGTVLAGTSVAGAGGWIAFMSMSKLQIGITAVLVVAGATAFGIQAEANADLRREVAALQAQQLTLAALRAESRQLATAAAEVEMLRRDDAELKQLARTAVEIKQASIERTRVAQARALDQTRERIRKLQAELQDLQNRAQGEITAMNTMGFKMVADHKALIARAQDTALGVQANAEAEVAAQAKLEEIKAKQAEIGAFIEKTRQALNDSPQMTELRALQMSLPLDVSAAEQQRVDERRRLEQRAAEIRAKSNSVPPSSEAPPLDPKD